MTEKDLVTGCINNNSHYQTLLYRKYAGKMMVVCMRYGNSRMEAEDMLQDGFIKVFDNIKSFQGKGSLEGWIRRIIVNNNLNMIRTNRIKFTDISEDSEQVVFDDFVIEKMAAKDILDAIMTLSKGKRAVFNLFAIEGYSHKEIGDILGIEEGTSRSQYMKARKLLKKKILDLDKFSLAI